MAHQNNAPRIVRHKRLTEAKLRHYRSLARIDERPVFLYTVSATKPLPPASNTCFPKRSGQFSSELSLDNFVYCDYNLLSLMFMSEKKVKIVKRAERVVR